MGAPPGQQKWGPLVVPLTEINAKTALTCVTRFFWKDVNNQWALISTVLIFINRQLKSYDLPLGRH